MANQTQTLRSALTKFHQTAMYLLWQKTKVQNLGAGDPAADITVANNTTETVTELRYLGSIQSSSGRYYPDLHQRIEVASSAMHSMQCCWRQKGLSLDTKLRLYQTCALQILLYGADPTGRWQTQITILPYVMPMPDIVCEVAGPCQERRHSRQDQSAKHCRYNQQIGNGTPASWRQMWQSADERGHHGESSQQTSAVYASWWWL